MTSKKRILFNLSSIYQSVGGVNRYSQELFKAICSNNIYQVIKFQNNLKKIKNNSLFNFLREVPMSYKLKKIYEDFNFRKYLFIEKKFDIYHETNFIFKPFKNKKILTVHDLSWLTHPQFHPSKRVIYMEKNFEKNLLQANAVLAVSHYVKNDLIKNFNFPAENIFVTHLASSSNFKKNLNDEEINNFLKPLGLKKNNFCLIISTLEPRKNLVNTIKAYNNLNIDKNSLPLVIVGSLGWNFQEILDQIKNSKNIIHLMNLSDKELNILLICHKISIFNSYTEGFGLPIVEAMNFSKPIITTDNSSMSEIALNSVIYNDPSDIDGLTKKISELNKNSDLYDIYSKKAQERGKLFSWSDCGKKTLEVYKTVLKY